MAEEIYNKPMQGQNTAEAGNSEEDKTACLRFINEVAATVILVFCVVGAIVSFYIFACSSNRDVVQHEYVYTIRVDSTGLITKASQAQIDSVISTIKEHEHAIKDRYEYLLEQRENSENYLTIGGIFVTIVLSVFGFFGYKSFKSIEEDAKASAKKIAADKAEEIAEFKANTVATKLNNKLNTELKKEQKEALQTFKKEVIPDCVSRVVEKKFGDTVGDKMTTVEAIQKKLPGIESDIVELKKMKDEVTLAKPVRRRISLADGPGIKPADLNSLSQNGDVEDPKSEA